MKMFMIFPHVCHLEFLHAVGYVSMSLEYENLKHVDNFKVKYLKVNNLISLR